MSGAIHAAAGSELAKECAKQDRCKTGETKITKGYKIPVKYIIHIVGPIWEGGESNEENLLASCYKNSLEMAIKHNIKTIAFPSISTGSFGYPIVKASRIAMKTVASFLNNHPEIKTVFFITDWNSYFNYDAALAELDDQGL